MLFLFLTNTQRMCHGSPWDDILNYSGQHIAVFPGSGDDIINLDSSFYISTNSVAGDWSVSPLPRSYGNDVINNNGGTVNGIMVGDTNAYINIGPLGKDIININGGSVGNKYIKYAVSGDVNVQQLNQSVIFGDDIINLNAGTLLGDVVGDYFGLVSGSGHSGGNDQINLLGSIVNGNIKGNLGNDEINLMTGTLNGSVYGDAGDDIINMVGAPVSGSIFGGAGADVIYLSGSVVGGSVNGQDGTDIIILDDGNVNRDILGGADDDVINLVSGSVGANILGGNGNDILTLAGASVTGGMSGELGDDAFYWVAGVTTSISGNDGSDYAEVTAVEYDGSQLLNGGDDYSTADGFIDTLVLHDKEIEVQGSNILFWENIIIDGGKIAISDGVLTTGSDIGTGLAIINGATLDATTNLILKGNLANNGVVNMQDGAHGDVIVDGNYSGSGILQVDVDFATGLADTMTINGDVTEGQTLLVVTDASTGLATNNDIPVVNVSGTTDKDDFALSNGAITVGAFDYDLALKDTTFMLRAMVNSTGATYQAAPAVLSGFNQLPTLEQRVGQRQWIDQDLERDELQPSTGGWIRIISDRLNASIPKADSRFKSDRYGLQAGADIYVGHYEEGHLALGVTAQYEKLNTNIINSLGTGSIDAEGMGVGATATWYGNSGGYLDTQGQVNWIDADYASSAGGSLIDGHTSKAYALSIEIGQRYEQNQNWALVPQAQLTWGKVDGGSFTDRIGNVIDLENNESLLGRLGLACEYENNDVVEGSRKKAYVIGNILHDFSDNNNVNVNDIGLRSAMEATWGELGVGGSIAPNDSLVFYGEISYRTPLNRGDDDGAHLTVGMRLRW